MEQTNLKKHLSFPIIGAILTIFYFTGCKKENLPTKHNLPEISINNGRLVFSKRAFTNLMIESHRKESTTAITDVISKLNGSQEFISLKQEAENIKTTGKLSAISLRNSVKMSIPGSKKNISISENQAIPVDVTEPVLGLYDLVPDPYFASVLSPAGEIEVDNTIYKITEQGTFFSNNDDETELDALADSLNNDLILSENLISQGEDIYILRNHQKIFFIDSYGKENANSIAISNSLSSIADFPVDENILSNVDVYQFNDAKTWAGIGLQNFFGRSHFKYYNYTNQARLKANFYSTNWGIFASVGVRSVIQTKGWTGLYRGLENFDEMRLGWRNMIIKLNIPQIEDPTAKTPIDFWNSVSKAISSTVNFRFNDQGKDYLVYRVSDIIEINNIAGFLPQDIRNSLNKLIEKTQNMPIDAGALVESQFDHQVIERLVKIIQSKAVDKTKGVAFTTRPRGVAIDQILIPSEWEYKYNENGDAIQTKTFDFQTAMIGLKSNENGNISPTFKPAETIEIKSGEVIALGKLNNEWLGIEIIKK